MVRAACDGTDTAAQLPHLPQLVGTPSGSLTGGRPLRSVFILCNESHSGHDFGFLKSQKPPAIPAPINRTAERGRPLWIIVSNSHQPEGIGRVTRPIVFWSKTDGTLLVLAFMVIAKRVTSSSVVASLNQHLDQSPAWRFDAVVENAEQGSDVILLDLVFDEQLGRLGEGLLNFTDADDASAF